MSFPITRFRLDQVGEESRTLALRPSGEWIARLDLGVEAEIGEPLLVDLSMIRSGEEVHVDGRLEGRINLACYRCLEPAAAGLAGTFRVTYLPAPADHAPRRGEEGAARRTDDLAGEPDPGDLDVYYHVDGVFDLLPMLREQILVALPQRALCREDCRGLCPSCGADLNAGGCECSGGEAFSKFEKLRALRIR